MNKKYDDEKNIEKKYGEGVSKVNWCHHRRLAAPHLKSSFFHKSPKNLLCRSGAAMHIGFQVPDMIFKGKSRKIV